MSELHTIAVLRYAPAHGNRLPAGMSEILPYIEYADVKRHFANEFLYNDACAWKSVSEVQKIPLFVDKVAYGRDYRLCWVDGSMSFATRTQLNRMRDRLGPNVLRWLNPR